MKPFERHLADRIGLDFRLGLGKNARRNEDLAVLGLAAQARRYIRHGANSAIVEAALEPDRADRGVAAGDSDPEAEVMAALLPGAREDADRVPHHERHAN